MVQRGTMESSGTGQLHMVYDKVSSQTSWTKNGIFSSQS